MTCNVDNKTYAIGERFIPDSCTGICECQLGETQGIPACVSLCPPSGFERCQLGYTETVTAEPVRGSNCTCSKRTCEPRMFSNCIICLDDHFMKYFSNNSHACFLNMTFQEL